MAARNAILVPAEGLLIRCPMMGCQFSTASRDLYASHMTNEHAAVPVPQLAAAPRRPALRALPAAVARLPLLEAHEPPNRVRRIEQRSLRCGRTFSTCRLLVARVSDDRPQPEPSPTYTFVDAERTTVQCPYCPNQRDVSFINFRVRRVHPNRPLPVMPQDEGVEPRPVLVRIEDTKRFRCCYCDEIKHRTWIIRHIRDAHPNQREPLFPPSFSNRRIATREAASQAGRVLPTGSLRCPVCDTVVMRQAMTRHMNTHTEADRRQPPQHHHERVRARRRVEVVLDHACPHCGVRVSSERALRNHLASLRPAVYQPAPPPGPASAKPYRRATCPQRYRSRAGLGHHIHCPHPHYTRGLFTRPDGTKVPVFAAPKRLLCPRCGCQFMNEPTLFRQNAVIHEHRVIPKDTP